MTERTIEQMADVIRVAVQAGFSYVEVTVALFEALQAAGLLRDPVKEAIAEAAVAWADWWRRLEEEAPTVNTRWPHSVESNLRAAVAALPEIPTATDSTSTSSKPSRRPKGRPMPTDRTELDVAADAVFDDIEDTVGAALYSDIARAVLAALGIPLDAPEGTIAACLELGRLVATCDDFADVDDLFERQSPAVRAYLGRQP